MMQQQDENDITATKVPSSRLGGGKGVVGDNFNKARTRTARKARRREPKSEHDERDDEFVGKEEKERYERWRRGLVREGEEERERDGY